MEKVENIRSILAEVLKLSNEEVSEIGVDDDLVTYELDSLSGIELVVYLESTYDIVIDEEDLLIENLSTINKISNMVDKYLEEN